MARVCPCRCCCFQKRNLHRQRSTVCSHYYYRHQRHYPRFPEPRDFRIQAAQHLSMQMPIKSQILPRGCCCCQRHRKKRTFQRPTHPRSMQMMQEPRTPQLLGCCSRRRHRMKGAFQRPARHPLAIQKPAASKSPGCFAASATKGGSSAASEDRRRRFSASASQSGGASKDGRIMCWHILVGSGVTTAQSRRASKYGRGGASRTRSPFRATGRGVATVSQNRGASKGGRDASATAAKYARRAGTAAAKGG